MSVSHLVLRTGIIYILPIHKRLPTLLTAYRIDRG